MANNPLAGFNVSYPAIEKLIDTEEFATVNKNFGAAYSELEKITKQKGGLGKVKQARKGMKALEKVMDLLAELLKLKYRLMASQEGVSSKEKGTGVSSPPKGGNKK
ncbi:MAG: hypothetical protein HYS22_08355 [Deltaproteobacteria bacterium]|nr:hypothetical protein [Deltaproteobacteria bacterium]